MTQWEETVSEHMDDEAWCRAIIQKCYEDELFFYTFFYSDVFDKIWTKQRRELVYFLNDLRVPYGYEIAYRGLGKTAILKVAACRRAVLRLTPYQLHVRRTEDEAIDFTESVKSMILLNPRITHPLMFGNLVPEKIDGYSPQFSKKSYFLSDPGTKKPFCFIEPVGMHSEVSGKQVAIGDKLHRPTWITVDDVEDRRLIDSEEYRARVRGWLFKSLFPCVSDDQPNPETNTWTPDKNDPAWVPPWQIWIQDTLKHEDSVMARVMNSAGWAGHVHPKGAFRDDGKLYSAAPELITNRQIRKEMRWYEEQNELDTFYVEMLCTPFARTQGHWSRDDFKYYVESNERIEERIPPEHRWLIVDPARTATASSADTAMLAVGVDENEPAIYMRRIIAEKINLQQIPMRAFETALDMNTDIIAVEITGAEDGLRYLFTNEAAKWGLDSRFEFIWLDARARATGQVEDLDVQSGKERAKRSRARPLIPFYKNGYVYHEKSVEGSALEQQMLSFPRPALWDALDVAGYVIVLMSRFGIRFASVLSESDLERSGATAEAVQKIRAVMREEAESEEDWDRFIQSGEWRLY